MEARHSPHSNNELARLLKLGCCVDVVMREESLREIPYSMNCAMRFGVLSLVAASFCVGMQAQGNCNIEAKLLLVPAQVQAAISSLHATRQLRTRIFFYDTPGLDLLSKGLILRLRQGASSDLTVKLRPLPDEQFVDSSSGGERPKCEVEITGGVEGRSYSMGTVYSAEHAPETGKELVRLLSSGQKRLIEDSQIQVDWTKVKRVADIRSTSWTVPGQASLNKFSMELWDWPSGKILEVSTKVGPTTGHAAYGKLESLAKKKGLALSAVQQSKTATALEEMNTVPAQ